MSMYSIKDILETTDEKERERKINSVIHSLIGILGVGELVERRIEDRFVPAVVVLYAREGSLFSCVGAVAIAMPDDIVKAVYAGESA